MEWTVLMSNFYSTSSEQGHYDPVPALGMIVALFRMVTQIPPLGEWGSRVWAEPD